MIYNQVTKGVCRYVCRAETRCDAVQRHVRRESGGGVSTYNLASRRGAFWRWANSVFAYKFGSFLLENSLNRLREVGILRT